MLVTTLLASLLASALAAPTTSAKAEPSVKISNGTVVGRGLSGIRVEQFNGIPYASPPTGPLRLRPPQPVSKSYGTLKLPAEARACPQQNTSSLDLSGIPSSTLQTLVSSFAPPSSQGEDCLTLDIARPSGVAPDAKLPVIFWIFGGGFEVGSTQNYNGSLLVNQSIALGKPAIYVAPNYRLSAFGLLPGRELQAEGSTNLALKDQRLAMKWVAENIAAFGGDPDKVVIWGESAGAISVYDQLIADGGDNTYHGKPLFRGAIMNSGAVARYDPIDAPQAQHVFDKVVSAAGCQSASDRLACLRSVPYEVFLNASNANPDFLSRRSLAISYPTRPDAKEPFFNAAPIDALSKGAYAKVPLIASNMEDDGTLLALPVSNLNTTQDLVDYFKTWFLGTPPKLIEDLVNSYPDDPAAGSPFRTGTANSRSPQSKRFAAIIGDYQFTLARRQALATMSKTQRTWSFMGSYLYGTPVLGTYHTSDLTEEFSLQPIAQVGKFLQSAYINFAYGLDPNGAGVGKHWPEWTGKSQALFNVSATSLDVTKDNFRQKSYEVFADHPRAFNV